MSTPPSRPRYGPMVSSAREEVRRLLTSMRTRPAKSGALSALTLVEAAVDAATADHVLKLYLDLVDDPGGLIELQRQLDQLGTWTQVKEGGDSPRGDRRGIYPGRPRPHHRDPNNEAHYRWSLMFHSLLYKLDVGIADVARKGVGSRTTLRSLLKGETWGMVSTRTTFTWHLWLLALQRFTVGELVTFLGNGGEWQPGGQLNVCWCLRRGRAYPMPPLPAPDARGRRAAA